VSSCIELVDLFAEGSVHLVIADFGNILLTPKLQAKLKVFKGNQFKSSSSRKKVAYSPLGFSLLKESNLTDLPCAVVACFTDHVQPRIPGNHSTNTI
jgi:hypothetical protein